MTWGHHNPVRVFSGQGCRIQLAEHLPAGNALMLTSAGMIRRGVAGEITAACPDQSWTLQTIEANPELDDMDQLADTLRSGSITSVVALGGGSAMDAAKAISVLLVETASGQLSTWLRGSGPVKLAQGIPVFCLPTTSGTGAEVTPFATIWDKGNGKKYSLAGEEIYPHTAFLDPELTLGLPADITLYSALDAMSHCLETLWNRNATPISIPLAKCALRVLVDNLPTVRAEPNNILARGQLQEASMMAGMAISQSKSAIAHSISYPLTARHGVPHGLACSFTLPAIIDMVHAQNAWATEMEDAFITSLKEVLQACGLKKHVEKFCSISDVTSCLPEMINPDRAGNFALDVGPDDVKHIIDNSLS